MKKVSSHVHVTNQLQANQLQDNVELPAREPKSNIIFPAKNEPISDKIPFIDESSAQFPSFDNSVLIFPDKSFDYIC